MKKGKKIATWIIAILGVALLSTGVIWWILFPYQVEVKRVDTVGNHKFYLPRYYIHYDEPDFDPSADFSDEEPSDDYRDYQMITFEVNGKYHSIFRFLELAAYPTITVPDSIQANICYVGEGGPIDGYPASETFYGGNVLLYCGDCENDAEIHEMVEEIAKNTTIHITYRMQWIGKKKLEVTLPEEFVDYEYSNFED